MLRPYSVSHLLRELLHPCTMGGSRILISTGYSRGGDLGVEPPAPLQSPPSDRPRGCTTVSPSRRREGGGEGKENPPALTHRRRGRHHVVGAIPVVSVLGLRRIRCTCVSTIDLDLPNRPHFPQYNTRNYPNISDDLGIYTKKSGRRLR